MAQQVQDWILQRLYGSPRVDGYGSQVIEYDANAQEANLGRNCVYLLQFRNEDGYMGIIDGYEAGASTNSDANRNAESSVTDANGMLVLAGTEKFVTTHTNRHILSIKRPDGSAGNGEVRIIKMEPGKSLKDSDNSA